jgi:hypothetical protein
MSTTTKNQNVAGAGDNKGDGDRDRRGGQRDGWGIPVELDDLQELGNQFRTQQQYNDCRALIT